MGQQLPQISNIIPNLQRKDFFQSKHIQRIKQTPFIDAQLYNTDPLIFIDPLGIRLFQLIKPRLGTKQLFPQQQIQKLITGVLLGLKDLQDNQYIGHGDICLQTLYYNKKDKQFMLRHPKFNQLSGYLLARHGKRFSCLSPQQLSALSQQSQNNQISIKSDLFTFGITLCQICTLTPSADVYCPQTYSIFHLQIQKRMKLVQQYYSPRIIQFISNCLIYDQDQRPDINRMLEIFLKEKVKMDSSLKKNPTRGVIYQ